MAGSGNKGGFYAANWCNTEVSVYKTSYLWVLRNFIYYNTEPNEEIYSGRFSPDSGVTEFELGVFPRGNTHDGHEGGDSSFVAVYLFIIDTCRKKRHINCLIDIKLMDHRKNAIASVTRSYRFGPGSFRGWGSAKMISREQLEKQLPDGDLVVYCDLCMYPDEPRISASGTFVFCPKQPFNERDLKCDLGELLTSDEFSDVTLVVREGDQEQCIRAHRLVLAARSKVFKAMFSHWTREHEEGRVLIDNVDAELFRVMVRFMYTDDVKLVYQLSATALCELLLLADRYDVPLLQFLCERELANKLNENNVAHVLAVIEKVNARSLKDFIVNWFRANFSLIKKTDAWRLLVRSYPDMVVEITSVF